jgi:hypothetical protein
MVAKDPESSYVAGRTLKWLTMPNRRIAPPFTPMPPTLPLAP